MSAGSERPRHPRTPGALSSGHPAVAQALRRARRPGALEEPAFVLRAVGIEHALVRTEEGWALVVHPEDALRADEELRRYREENRAAHDGAPPRRSLVAGRVGAAVYALVISGLYAVQQLHLGGIDWEAAGRTDAQAIRRGALWRAATALTLHADLHHLLGNLVFGALFGGLLCQLVGNGVGWAAVLAAGILGNLLNGLLEPAGHTSIGASTAVFGALGALASLSVAWRAGLHTGWLRRWAPLGLALALLGYLGTAGEHTDVVAHATGFLAGAAIGLALGRRRAPAPAGRGVQVGAGALALGLLALAWGLALGVARPSG